MPVSFAGELFIPDVGPNQQNYPGSAPVGARVIFVVASPLVWSALSTAPFADSKGNVYTITVRSNPSSGTVAFLQSVLTAAVSPSDTLNPNSVNDLWLNSWARMYVAIGSTGVASAANSGNAALATILQSGNPTLVADIIGAFCYADDHAVTLGLGGGISEDDEKQWTHTVVGTAYMTASWFSRAVPIGPFSFTHTADSGEAGPHFGWAAAQLLIVGSTIPSTEVEGLDLLRHPLTQQLLVTYIEGGAAKARRYTDDENDTVAQTVTVDAGPNCHRPKWQCLQDGIIRLLYQKSTSYYLAESRDIGRTWTVTTLPFSGDLVTYEWLTLLQSRTVPVVMVYTESTKLWKVSVGQLDTDNETWIWSTPVSIGVLAKKELGRIQQRIDGMIEFLFKDDATSLPKIVRCEDLGVNGSGTWT